MKKNLTYGLVVLLLVACSRPDGAAPAPTQVIDLTSTITVDQPVRLWGRRMLSDFGFSETNEFDFVINREPVYSSNSYWTIEKIPRTDEW